MLALDLQKELEEEEESEQEEDMTTNQLAVLEQKAIFENIMNRSKSTSVELPESGALEGAPIVMGNRRATAALSGALEGRTNIGAPIERIEEIVFHHQQSRKRHSLK